MRIVFLRSYHRFLIDKNFKSFCQSLSTCHKLLNDFKEKDGANLEEKQNEKTQKNKKLEEAKLKMNELLKSLSKLPDSAISKINLSQPKPRKKPELKMNIIEEDAYLDASLKRAVKNVAEELGGDRKETEQELFSSLKSHSTDKSLSELLCAMKIDRSVSPIEEQKKDSHYMEDGKSSLIPPKSRLHEFRRKNDKFRETTAAVDLFSGAPLGIFSPDDVVKSEDDELSTWKMLHERELKIRVTPQPRNAFEEMIQWTERGKLWTFPIDNEFGLEEEKKCSFSDHIFLERHLEDWCPKKGPIRNFMELVCVGLSKNPHLTVARKKAHIEWYKNYFESKRTLLQEVGAL